MYRIIVWIRSSNSGGVTITSQVVEFNARIAAEEAVEAVLQQAKNSTATYGVIRLYTEF